MASFGARRTYPIVYVAFFVLFPLKLAVAESQPTLLVDKVTCLQLTETVRPRENADYVAGVDAYGRTVVPAEDPSGGGWSSSIAGGVPVDLSVDLGKRTGLGDEGRLFLGEAAIGRVTVKDGEVLIGGKPIGDPELVAIRQACRHLKSE